MAIAGPFYFAWVDPTETTFTTDHQRMDEYIFSARRLLAEGEKPKLELVIENPRVGLLSALRKQWAWFAWHNGTSAIPLFFGRVVGIPSDLQAETLAITLIAWPKDYVQQLQLVAEGLKIPPFYDPVFTDVASRDNPMAIFESHSKMICVDPVTLAVTASYILDAEDGNLDFTEDDAFYGSVNMSPGSPPKTAVHIDMSVSWTQTAAGYLDMGNETFTSYSGDGILSDWPKPLAQISPGLSVAFSDAVDALDVTNALTATYTWQWKNGNKTHNDGDTLSTSISQTVPMIKEFISDIITFDQQNGYLDPFATDQDGDPAPVNIPPHYNATLMYAAKYIVNTSLTFEYRAERAHTERAVFTLFADVQPTTLDPTVSEDSDTISITGSDVGVPIVDLLNWTAIAGQSVAVGTVIFPDNPQLPGGRTAQRATVAGTAGLVEPEFSDIAGETTADGGVTWASLGAATPPENAPDWTAVSNVPVGTMILPRRPLYTTWQYITQSGRAQFPKVGVSVSEGQIVQTSNGSFQVCILSGTTEFVEPSFSTVWNTVTVDGSAEWASLGMALPTGSSYFVATTPGTTGGQWVIPAFNNALHATTSDGSVVWSSVGTGDIPAGGTTGNVPTSSYFARDRGRQSLEYGICRGRARLRFCSRAVSTNFSCSYLRGTALTLRKSATLHDYRLPGGLVLGKVTGVELIADADAGEFTCKATIQSAVGLDTSVVAVPGDPTYVSDGYVTGYQQRTNTAIVLPPVISDVGYTPLVAIPDDDGISFPLTRSMIVVSEATHGTLAAQEVGLRSAFESAKLAAVATQGTPTTIDSSVQSQTQATLANANSVPYELKRNPIWKELQLKPINATFNRVYHLKCTRLALPMHVDLREESMS